jgi:16S rRNA (uracil1498-N3)-methyltransferase
MVSASSVIAEAREHGSMADRYFVDQPLGPGRVEVDGPEAHHLATVCRLRTGDTVHLFNGDGREYPAAVVAVGRRSVALEVTAELSPERELPFRLEVAAALPKGERAPFLIEKLTELGVTVFTPLETAYSVVRPREAKLDRLHRHVIEASKQCGRNRLMEVRALIPWADFLRRDDLPTRRFLAHPGHAKPDVSVAENVVVAVGPEGGFTTEEVSAALSSSWLGVGLGPRLLRVETAAIALGVLFARTGIE